MKKTGAEPAGLMEIVPGDRNLDAPAPAILSGEGGGVGTKNIPLRECRETRTRFLVS